MKRNVLIFGIIGLLIIILVSVFIIIKSKKSDNTKTLEYFDDKTGNKVVFEYPEDEKFEITKEGVDGAYKEIEFKNEELNIKGDMYFIREYNKSFEKNKEANKDADNFKEYKANGFDSFYYTQSNENTIHNKILVANDEDEGLSLYMYLEKNDYDKDSNLLDSFNDDVFQDFIKSIKYEKK